jgi:hypothetical protein
MNNPIEEQRQLIDKLYRLVRQSAPKGSSEAACRFRYFQESDGSRAVDEQFWYFVDEKRVSALLVDEATINPMLIVPELHAKMRAHTGGDWHAFTLSIEKDGRVNAKLEYPEEKA